jgi:hypothetical protein
LVLKQAFGKSGQMPAFSYESKVAVPKTEVSEQPQMKKINREGAPRNTNDPIPQLHLSFVRLLRRCGKNFQRRF